MGNVREGLVISQGLFVFCGGILWQTRNLYYHGASIVLHYVKSPLLILTSQIRVLIRVPATLFLIQLPAPVSVRKQWKTV